jgi:prepilin-type N-terminal cleavage/methylation domain-containing protein
MRKQGFTLIELLICVLVFIILFSVLLSVYRYCFELQSTSRDTANALSQLRTKIEEIRGTPFDNIITDFNNRNVGMSGLNGQIRSEASCTYRFSGGHCGLIDMRVIAGWAARNNRIIGEGRLDSSGRFVFSDLNGNGIIESPIELTTAVKE